MFFNAVKANIVLAATAHEPIVTLSHVECDSFI